MLDIIIVILVLMWLLGMLVSVTFNGLLHLALLVAAVVLIIRLIRGNTLL